MSSNVRRADAGDILEGAYHELLDDLKNRIRNARVRAALNVNRELTQLYWQIGQAILERQAEEGRGAKVIERLADDLRREFTDMKGLSRANLFCMRAFAEAYPNEEIVQQLAAQIPWFHNCLLLDRVEDSTTRRWYIQAAIENGWSRHVLSMQIDRQAHKRQGKAVNNFALTLPPADSDMAAQVFKDPYLFDFLGTADPRREREVEQALVDHVQKFLLELGAGFAFVGRQVHLEFSDSDYYLDLLFYHLKLRCFVVVELKAVPFDPEFVGKLNMYLSAVDDLLRHPDDKPTIGLLLCKGRNRIKAEYALRNFGKPLGVADWKNSSPKLYPAN